MSRENNKNKKFISLIQWSIKKSKNLGKQTNPRAINVQATVRIIPSTVPNSNDFFFKSKIIGILCNVYQKQNRLQQNTCDKQ